MYTLIWIGTVVCFLYELEVCVFFFQRIVFADWLLLRAADRLKTCALPAGQLLIYLAVQHNSLHAADGLPKHASSSREQRLARRLFNRRNSIRWMRWWFISSRSRQSASRSSSRYFGKSSKSATCLCLISATPILCGFCSRLPHCGCGCGCGTVEKSNRIAACVFYKSHKWLISDMRSY